MRLSEFRDAFIQELSEPLYDLVGDRPFERWVNVGQRLLGSYLEKSTQVTWQQGAVDFPLPADFHHIDTVIPISCAAPKGSVWGNKFVFSDAAWSGGEVTLRYYAVRPAITGTAPSTLSDDGNEALVSYGLYRFFKRIASSRSDYRMYATITQSNGVDISELDDLSERHKLDFDAVAQVISPVRATTFYD